MPDQPALPDFTVRALRATPVEVPLNFVLGTSQGAFRQAPLLIDLVTEEGVTGRGCLLCYLRAAVSAIMSLLGEVATVTKGDTIDPAGRWCRNVRAMGWFGIGPRSNAIACVDRLSADARSYPKTVAIPDQVEGMRSGTCTLAHG